MHHVYKITNKNNGKVYIGITGRCFDYRWKQHLRHAFRYNSQYKLHRALRKHGEDAFTVELLETANTAENALKREVELIAEYSSYGSGYNLTPGGDHYINGEWQRNNQLLRVANGSHPFVGGTIQAENGKKRWKEGTHVFIGLNEKRVLKGTHNFQGDDNPARRKAAEGRHHNQKPAWENTKAKRSLPAWKIADRIFAKFKETGWSYRNLQTHFEIDTNLMSMVKKFQAGWNPLEDPQWITAFK